MLRNIEKAYPTTYDLLKLKDQLEQIRKSQIERKVFVGFDGFIDRIQKVVKKKKAGKNIFFDSIQEFSKHIGSLSGKSGQFELVTAQTKAGGNAPILSMALAELKIKSYCVGAMGSPISPLFVMPNAETASINAPGNSQAVEFNDGKIIFSDLSNFIKYDWNFIKTNVGLDKIRETIKSCNLVALVDWSNLPNATDIWQGLLDDVIKVANREDFHFLFDLCDPSKREATEIDEVLDVISSFSPYGKVTLALNENEARKIWAALNGYGDSNRTDSSTLLDIGSFIYYTMKIDTLVIHPIDRALGFQKNTIIELAGRLVTEPKVLTGGGDNFNAGYSLGLLNGLPLYQRMLLSIVTAGAYVQNGKSPCITDQIDYLDNWLKEIEKQKDVNALSVHRV